MTDENSSSCEGGARFLFGRRQLEAAIDELAFPDTIRVSRAIGLMRAVIAAYGDRKSRGSETTEPPEGVQGERFVLEEPPSSALRTELLEEIQTLAGHLEGLQIAAQVHEVENALQRRATLSGISEIVGRLLELERLDYGADELVDVVDRLRRKLGRKVFHTLVELSSRVNDELGRGVRMSFQLHAAETQARNLITEVAELSGDLFEVPS